MTLPDLQYQQVIGNLAKIGSNPGLPPFISRSRGKARYPVTDNGSSALGLICRPRRTVIGTIYVKNLTRAT